MRSDVPIATSLSGGLDSSSVVVALSELARRGGGGERTGKGGRTTFVHSFPGTPLDETRYARRVAEAAGVEIVTVEADEGRIQGELDAILYSFEGIYGGMPDALYRLYGEQRRRGVVVTLDGHGADEMLGGYPSYVNAAMDDAPVFSRRFRSLFRQHQEMHGELAPPAWRTLFLALLRRPILRRPADAVGLTRAAKRRLRHPFLAGEATAIEPYEPIATELPRGWPAVQRLLYQDFHHSVLPRILRCYDLMSMAHGVEVRMPFMDYRLVNFSFSLPAESKIGGGFTKLILREAMRGLLPEEIRVRKGKIGFNSPLLQWFQGPLAPWLERALGGTGSAEGLVDVAALRAFHRERVRTGKLGWDEAIRFWTAVSALELTRIVDAPRARVGGAASA
jgi:asparagine synthase (glutamine-hydrolysing)